VHVERRRRKEIIRTGRGSRTAEKKELVQIINEWQGG